MNSVLMGFAFSAAGASKKAVVNSINTNIENTISRLQTHVNSNIDTIKTEPNKIDALIPNDNGIKLDEDKVIAGMWEDAENTTKNTLNTNVEKSRFKNVEKVNENGIIERTRVLTLEDLTSNVLKTKPPNSRIPKDWIKNGGSIEIDSNGNWIYTDWFGISVKYVNGHPDYNGAGAVRQEVDIVSFVNRGIDRRKANKLAPNGPRKNENVWHHLEDGHTMQEVDGKIHRRFTHKGGNSLWNRKE